MFSFFKKWTGSTTNFAELIENGALFLDVRTKTEFEAGHIAKAKNIPLDQLPSKLDQLKNLGKPVITLCRSGARSGMAKGILQKAGVEVYNGGGWIAFKNKYAVK